MKSEDAWNSRDWTRRRLLLNALLGLGALSSSSWPWRARAASPGSAPLALPKPTLEALGKSPLVYISPLRKDGSESRCHGEVWYFFDGEAVVIVTAKDRWKARAIRGGGDRARVWVGDFGTVGQAKERYRQAPTFLARSEIVKDRALFDRLMSAYAGRYPSAWGKWKGRFEKGYGDGSRVMIRYTPIAKD